MPLDPDWDGQLEISPLAELRAWTVHSTRSLIRGSRVMDQCPALLTRMLSTKFV